MKKKNIKSKAGLLVLFSLLIMISCDKDAEKTRPPEIWLKSGQEFICTDTTIASGNLISFGIMASSGSANITNLVIKKAAGGTEQSYLDSGLNSAVINVNKIFIKGNEESETWSFIVMDKNRSKSSVSLVITRDTISVYGTLINFPKITLGAQDNTSTGSFLSLSGSMVYKLQDAFSNQEVIDMLYYFGPEAHTIASPGANVEAGIYTGPCALENWSIRRETRYIQVNLTPQDFDQIQNDSLLLTLYTPPDGKRKAKNLVVNDIYVFLAPDNRLGIFRVGGITGTNAGSIDVYVKIQQP